MLYDSLGGGSVRLKHYFCIITTFTLQTTVLRYVAQCPMFDDYHLPQNKLTRHHISQNTHLNTHSCQKLKYDTVFTKLLKFGP